VRHQNALTLLHVARADDLTPRMRRIVLAGEALRGFTSLAADDHIKLFLPQPGQDRPSLPLLGPNGPEFPAGELRPIMRDYTPRRFDTLSCELTIDFVLHGDGPASSWAARAEPGQIVGIGGPRGSFLAPDNADCLLLLGDETALPAIGRRLEELAPGARAIALIEVEDSDEELKLPSAGSTVVHWLHRRGTLPGRSDLLLAALRDMALPAGDLHVWMAGEIAAMHSLRLHMLTERGLRRDRVRAAGYWRHGSAGAHERIEE
jgi:NADPH-dependent ferric siderophore reductase